MRQPLDAAQQRDPLRDAADDEALVCRVHPTTDWSETIEHGHTELSDRVRVRGSAGRDGPDRRPPDLARRRPRARAGLRTSPSRLEKGGVVRAGGRDPPPRLLRHHRIERLFYSLPHAPAPTGVHNPPEARGQPPRGSWMNPPRAWKFPPGSWIVRPRVSPPTTLHVAHAPQSQPQHLVFWGLTGPSSGGMVFESLDRRRPASSGRQQVARSQDRPPDRCPIRTRGSRRDRTQGVHSQLPEAPRSGRPTAGRRTLG